MRRNLICAATLLLVAACSSRHEPPAERAPVAAPIQWREAGINFETPARWDAERLAVRRLEADSAAAEFPGAAYAVVFDYRAEQPGNRNQPVLCLLVIERSGWAAQLARGDSLPGEEIAVAGEWVYAAWLPRENPYRAGMLDADQFDAMRLSLDEVREAFSVEGGGPVLAKR